MEVTASGVPKPRRQQLQALVERLRGSWSGALTVGRTAAVIVEGPILDWEAPKLAVAQRHGIPLVSTEWLLDSAAHGFLLATGAYELEPPPAARRSSAASTSLAATGPPSASATCAAAAPPRSPHHPVVAQQAAERRAASPEVERLRGEARLLQPSPLAPLLLERSAGPASPAWPTGSPAGTKAAPLAVAHDTLQDLPPSPASPGGPVSMGSARRVTSSAAFSGLLQQSNCASGGSAAVPSPRWLTGSGKGSPAALEATPVSCTSSDGSNGSAAGSPVEQDRRTDSDTKVARFLRLQPWVTLRRGSQHVRRFMRPDSISSKGTSIRSSPVGTDAGGSPGSCDGGTPQPFTQVEADGAAEQPDKQPAAALSLQQEQRRRGLQPTPPSILRRWYTLSVARMQPSMVEGRLPATTLIRLGPQQEQQPGASTLEGIAERHCGGALGAEAVRQLPQLSFHSSAEALLEGGEELRFTAGDVRHGAIMLYDVLPDGRRVHALALLSSIYRLRDEAWAEHRYLFTADDAMERPAWAAALKGHALQPGEVLLSSGSYHSPMHLITGEFWLGFPGRAQRRRPGQGAAHPAGGTAGERQPSYVCRRAFDAAAVAVVPLRRALEGFMAAM